MKTVVLINGWLIVVTLAIVFTNMVGILQTWIFHHRTPRVECHRTQIVTKLLILLNLIALYGFFKKML